MSRPSLPIDVRLGLKDLRRQMRQPDVTAPKRLALDFVYAEIVAHLRQEGYTLTKPQSAPCKDRYTLFNAAQLLP